MATVDITADQFNVRASNVKAFDIEDPFNKGNVIAGYICQSEGPAYGAMIIDCVNGETTQDQVIYCTPKLRYPFSKDIDGAVANYTWPKDMGEIRIYDKWDGTNVLCYMYQDISNTPYITFKLRRAPVLRNGKYGAFVDMWNELLIQYPDLRNPASVYQGWNLSFEMYGYRNPILIEYPFALQTTLLFGVNRSTGEVVKPEQFTDDIPSEVMPNEPSVLSGVNNSSMITAVYEQRRHESGEENIKLDGGMIQGSEGLVVYVKSSEYTGYRMYKAKPDDILEVHWASDIIGGGSIKTTVLNALEEMELDDLTVEYIVEMLGEEFNEQSLEKSADRIKRVYYETIEQLKFVNQVRNIYKTAPNVIKSGDKGALMRHMSASFDRKKMGQVFSALKAIGAVE